MHPKFTRRTRVVCLLVQHGLSEDISSWRINQLTFVFSLNFTFRPVLAMFVAFIFLFINAGSVALLFFHISNHFFHHVGKRRSYFRIRCDDRPSGEFHLQNKSICYVYFHGSGRQFYEHELTNL